jgi:hypothetical protein
MADTMTARQNGLTDAPVQPEDLVSVRSRISWGAVIAGSVLALSLYFLLTLLGGAIGLSVGDKVDPRALGIGAAVYAIVITALCLFIGGGLASQLTAGENRREACVYGLMVWAVVFAMLLWLMASGVRAGFNAMVGVATAGTAAATAAGQNTTQADWEEAARRAGYTQQQIEEFKQRAKDTPAQVREAVNDPNNRAQAEQTAREVGDATTRVTWYTFLGTLVSMLAAAAGGYFGAGPSFRLFNAPVASVRRTEIITAR